jgi:branched-chain amino acid transport system permease protein
MKFSPLYKLVGNNRWWRRGLLSLLFLFLPFLTPHPSLASEMLIFALFALSWDILGGYAGLFSFGHGAYFGIGAYAVGLMSMKLQALPIMAVLGTGALASAIGAFIPGVLSVRRKGTYFVMLTLAFSQMYYFIAFKWTSLTGGEDGLHGIARRSFGPLSLDSETHFYYFVLGVFLISFLLALRIANSPFGRALQGIKNNEDRAKSIGFDTAKFRLIAFMLSAFFSGLAGGLYALHLNFVPVETLSIMTSGDVVIMALFGGIGTLYGPVFGAMFIVCLKNILGIWTDQWNLILGVLFVMSVLIFPDGVFRELKEWLFHKAGNIGAV